MPIKFDPDHPDANEHGLRYIEGPESQWEAGSEGARELDESFTRNTIMGEMYRPLNAQRPLGSGGTVGTLEEQQLQHLSAVVELGEAYAAEGFDITRGAHSGGDAPRDPRSAAELEDALNTTGQLTGRQWMRRAGLGR